MTAQSAVVMLQHAITYLDDERKPAESLQHDLDASQAIYIFASAIPLICIDALQNGEIIDPLLGA